jgi:hypothetical protein
MSTAASYGGFRKPPVALVRIIIAATILFATLVLGVGDKKL